MASEEFKTADDYKREKQHFCDELIAEISKYEAALAKRNDPESINSDYKPDDDPMESYTKQQLIDHINTLRQQNEPSLQIIQSEEEKEHDIVDDIDLKKAPMTPIRLMLEFCVPNDQLDGFKSAIIRASTLPIQQQLAPLMTNTDDHPLAFPNTEQQQLTTLLFSDAAANDVIKFLSVLTLFNQKRVRVQNVSLSQWDVEQIALSFLMYTANQVIRGNTQNDNELQLRSELTASDAKWWFIHFLRRFCIENQCNGIKLKELWDVVTENEFGNTLTQRVCSHFELDIDRFLRSTDMLPNWCNDELRRCKTHPVVLEECTVEDIVTLLTFDAVDDGMSRNLGSDSVDGVFSRFKKMGGDDTECLLEIDDWKEKIVEWVRNEGVDGAEMTEMEIQDTALLLANALLPDDMSLSKKKTLRRALKRQCVSILSLCKNTDIYHFFEAVTIQKEDATDGNMNDAVKRRITRFDALKQYLVHQHDVDEKEIDSLQHIVMGNGYESETLLLSEKWMSSGKAPWNQLECARLIGPFIRDRECMLTLFLCTVIPMIFPIVT